MSFLRLAPVFAALSLALTAHADPTGRVIELSVTDEGFTPSPVKVQKGEPVTLVITRKTDETCAKEIVVPDYGLRAKLPLNKPVSLTLTPNKSGELRYGCGMRQMVHGVLTVE